MDIRGGVLGDRSHGRVLERAFCSLGEISEVARIYRSGPRKSAPALARTIGEPGDNRDDNRNAETSDSRTLRDLGPPRYGEPLSPCSGSPAADGNVIISRATPRPTKRSVVIRNRLASGRVTRPSPGPAPRRKHDYLVQNDERPSGEVTSCCYADAVSEAKR